MDIQDDLRTAAIHCVDPTLARQLRGCATAIDAAYLAIKQELSHETMIRLTGHVARARLLLDQCKPIVPPSDRGGALRAGAVLQKAA